MTENVKRGFYAHASTDQITKELEAKGYRPQLISEPNDSSIDEHSHERSHIIVLLKGELNLTLGDRSFAMQAGDLITIPPGQKHAAQSGENGCDYIWVEV